MGQPQTATRAVGRGVGVIVGVSVGAGVEVWLGVAVSPIEMDGMLGKIEQAIIAAARQSPRTRRGYFIPFLYWERRRLSTGSIRQPYLKFYMGRRHRVTLHQYS